MDGGGSFVPQIPHMSKVSVPPYPPQTGVLFSNERTLDIVNPATILVKLLLMLAVLTYESPLFIYRRKLFKVS